MWHQQYHSIIISNNISNNKLSRKKELKMSNKTGNFCSCYRFGDFKKINEDFWLEEMIRNSSLVGSKEPNDEQCRAWLNCRKVLLKTLKNLPESYNDVWLVFEYVLPNHKPGTKKYKTEEGIRPDVLAVGKNFINVLEFKQRKLENDGTYFEGFLMQAKKYVTRLNKYHPASQDKFVSSILVMVLAKDYLDDLEDSIVCSGNRLAEAMLLLNSGEPEIMNYDQMKNWLSAGHIE